MQGNRVLLIGYVGQHLASSKLDNGTRRVGIRIATHYEYKNDQGEKVDNTVWHNIVAWDDTAAYAERSFVKGSKIMVEGMLDYRVFKKKDGNTMYLTQIRATSLINLDR
jgi:single-strand DNA-binding protein